MIQATASSVISTDRPLRGASKRALSVLPSIYLLTHSQTVFVLISYIEAMFLIDMPLALSKRICARITICACIVLCFIKERRYSLSAIIHDGNRYRFDIVEQKTQKKREFTVPIEIYSYIQNYVLENNINPAAKLFDISERTVQNHLQLVCNHLGFDNIFTHSFRKLFASSIYMNNGNNIELVRVLLQHLSVATTQRYIGLQRREIEEALQKHIKLL